MPNYIRPFAPGGTFFFTVNLRDRRSDLLVREVGRLRAAFAATMRAQPFRIDAVVVLPDHLHAVLTLPEGDADFSGRWRRIKSAFTKSLPEEKPTAALPTRPGERGLWQRRFWEHLIRDEADLEAHLAYCWMNPVKHGHVERAADWPWSSFHREVRRGWFAEDGRTRRS